MFFFGDLNYRIDMDREKVVEICSTMSEAKVTAQTRPESAPLNFLAGLGSSTPFRMGMLRVARIARGIYSSTNGIGDRRRITGVRGSPAAALAQAIEEMWPNDQLQQELKAGELLFGFQEGEARACRRSASERASERGSGLAGS